MDLLVSNLPAEITHLLEEIQAKDKVMHECRKAIAQRDNSIQRFIQANGSHAINPKEDGYNTAVDQAFKKAYVLQEEKLALSEKACLLVSIA
jgi:inhibitor of growth protein 3